jgi:general secretion pathway protein I
MKFVSTGSQEGSRLFRLTPRKRGGAEAGFTLIEVLVALGVLAVALAAIGSLMATTVRGTRSIDSHVTLVETARSIMTGLPDRNQLAIGNFSGEIAEHKWRTDVLPFISPNVDQQLVTPWTPQRVVVRVQSPAGAILQIETIRLRKRGG